MTHIAGTIRPDGIYQPELVVSIETPKIQFNLTALLDSGADGTLFPAEEVEAYGILFADLPEAGAREARGVSADCSFTYRHLAAVLQWDGETFATEVSIAEPGGLDIGLLGRADFFRTFKVGFEGWREDPPWLDVEHYPRALHLA